jgi:ABC-type branched-subunit amino acid transport system substrate-binding protein
MNTRAIAVFAMTSVLAAFASAQVAPLQDNESMLRQIAPRLGQVVGAASACPGIAKTRIENAREKVADALKTARTGEADAYSPIKIFEANVTAGAQAITGRQSDCDATERELRGLERVYGPAPATLQGSKRGIADHEIRFGIVAPLTGTSKKLGEQMKIGIEAAFMAANDAGGTHGRKLKLFAADDGYEPSRTLQAMKELYEKDDVFAFIGNVGTPTAAIAMPYALDRRMLFFGAFTGADILRNEPPDRYVFNYRASYAEETAAVVNYLLKVRGIKPEEIAVFAQNDAFGDAGYAGVSNALHKFNDGSRAIVPRLNYTRNTSDVDRAVLDLKVYKKPIKAIAMVATYRAAAKFIERSRKNFPNLIYTNVSFVGSTALLDELAKLNIKNVEDVIITQVVPPIEGYSSVVLEYKAAISNYFNNEPLDYVSLEGYIAARLLIEALNRTGPQLDTERLVGTLENMHDVDLGLGFRINFSKEDHQGSHKIWATQLTEAGKYQVIKLQ